MSESPCLRGRRRSLPSSRGPPLKSFLTTSRSEPSSGPLVLRGFSFSSDLSLRPSLTYSLPLKSFQDLRLHLIGGSLFWSSREITYPTLLPLPPNFRSTVSTSRDPCGRRPVGRVLRVVPFLLPPHSSRTSIYIRA